MTVWATPNQQFEATLAGGTPASTYAVSIVDGPTARTLATVTAVEFPSGFYTATFIAPNEEGQFAIVWPNGAGEDLFVDGRVVNNALPPIFQATYATPTDVRDYTTNADLIALDDATMLKYIAKAEVDVDRAVGIGERIDARRFDPNTLVQADRTTLARATAAQVEYRFVMGDDFFASDQYAETSGPEFTTRGTLDRIGPAVYDELAGSTLLKLSTSWNGDGRAPSWYSFAYNVDASAT